MEVDSKGIQYQRTGKILTSGSTAPQAHWSVPVIALGQGDRPFGDVYLPPFPRFTYAGAAITNFEVVDLEDPTILLERYSTALYQEQQENDKHYGLLQEALGIMYTYRHKKLQDFVARVRKEIR